MKCSFQDRDNLYLVMDYFSGGDLRFHVCVKRKFSETQTKFFIGCLLLGLEYIHAKNIIHRDIKPENLVCDDKGYVAITDFGVAKKNLKDNSSETSGTPGYMAPEVLCAKNHSFPVDFFAIGVMGYEFMLGVRPYLGKNRKEIKEKVLAKQARVHKDDRPSDWSANAVTFINAMLQRKPENRLGYNGISEVKQHEWFEGFEWDELYNKKMESPFLPRRGDNFDKRYCEGVDKIGTETEERYIEYMSQERYKTLFANYTYIHCEEDESSAPKETVITTASTNNNNSIGTSKLHSVSMNKYLNIPNVNNNNSKEGGNLHHNKIDFNEIYENGGNNNIGRYNKNFKVNIMSNPNSKENCGMNNFFSPKNPTFINSSRIISSSKDKNKQSGFPFQKENSCKLYQISNEKKIKFNRIFQHSSFQKPDGTFNNVNNSNGNINYGSENINNNNFGSNMNKLNKNNFMSNQYKSNSNFFNYKNIKSLGKSNNMFFEMNFPFDLNQRKIKERKFPKLSKNSSMKQLNPSPSYFDGLNSNDEVTNNNNQMKNYLHFKKNSLNSNSYYYKSTKNIFNNKNVPSKLGLQRPASYQNYSNNPPTPLLKNLNY